MHRLGVFLVLIGLAVPLNAAYADRDLVLPVVGRVTSGAGRLFLTAVWLTNVDDTPATVRLSFLATGQANLHPRATSMTIAPHESRVLDPIPAAVVGSDDVIGALRIESNANMTASARIYGYYPAAGPNSAVSVAMTAIPARLAIGNGQSTLLHGFSRRNARYSLYLAETSGAPLQVNASLEDLHGRVVAEKRILLDRYAHVRASLDDIATPGIDHVVVKVTGVNGEGRFVAAATQVVPGSEDACAFEMSFPPEPRSRIRAPEAAVYVVLALALCVSVVVKNRPQRQRGT